VPAVETACREALLEVQQRAPHSSIVLLAALAEGADRLAARVGLDLGMRLVVPLPMPRDLYEDDFRAPGSREEFAALLDRSSGIVQLSLLGEGTREDIREQGPARDHEYAKVGAYIARHSQVFLAFWDGVPESTDTIGGTAHTAGFRLRGVPSLYASRPHALLIVPTTGPVVHIQTPRRSNPSAAASPGSRRLLQPEDGNGDGASQILSRIDLFNAEARRHHHQLDAEADQSVGYLLNIDRPAVAGVLVSLPASCQRIAAQYAAADGLALQFAARTRLTLKRVTLGVGAAAILFHLHAASFEPHAGTSSSVAAGLATLPWLLIAFIALSSFTATGIYERAEKREYQTKYLDYRALAEALRIQFFWRIAGVGEPVVDYYLRKQHSALEWIRSALKSCDVLTSAAGSMAVGIEMSHAERMGLITAWIKDQRRYFASKARSEGETLEKERRTVLWLLRTSGGLAAVLAFVLAIPFISTVVPWVQLRALTLGHVPYEALMIIVPLLAVGAGLLATYGRLLARAEHVRQFTRMSELFAAGERELERQLASGPQAEATTLVRELGIEALDENGDWLILHRERPIEVPKG